MTKDQMLARGFTYAGTCNCDGITNYKYSKDGFIFYIRPKRKEFHVKRHVNYLKKHIQLSNFDATEKEIFPPTD